jgi:hypothetical protein
MQRSRILALVSTIGSALVASGAGALFEQPFLAVVGGILLLVFASLAVVAFGTFLPILAERERIENDARRRRLERPPDYEP